jgi:mediator of RNA polymerase II transcription subunit 8
VLQQLLRKKAEPTVEDWVEDNTNPAKVAKWDNGRDTGLGEDEQAELWAFAKPTSTQTAGHMYSSGAFDYEYTLAEKEAGVDSVITGLRRKLNKTMDDDDEDDEDEDEDEEMEDRVDEDIMPAAKPPNDPFGAIKSIDKSKPALPIEAWLKFMSVMAMPSV